MHCTLELSIACPTFYGSLRPADRERSGTQPSYFLSAHLSEVTSQLGLTLLTGLHRLMHTPMKLASAPRSAAVHIGAGACICCRRDCVCCSFLSRSTVTHGPHSCCPGRPLRSAMYACAPPAVSTAAPARAETSRPVWTTGAPQVSAEHGGGSCGLCSGSQLCCAARERAQCAAPHACSGAGLSVAGAPCACRAGSAGSKAACGSDRP